ncbi:hypothetical protein N8H22_03145 [Stutzerimonas stutzeri]|uniref:hypothetical protein n=1 Tax=Stutzerimonas sp. S1 TaxID=3030652 RepID=UPI0022248554|nr:hypothetical protein [Stutzerimonas sp. S1]MCW3147600.1 hypothetical protein [Stutzerimonas sp. S1]
MQKDAVLWVEAEQVAAGDARNQIMRITAFGDVACSGNQAGIRQAKRWKVQKSRQQKTRTGRASCGLSGGADTT